MYFAESPPDPLPEDGVGESEGAPLRYGSRPAPMGLLRLHGVIRLRLQEIRNRGYRNPRLRIQLPPDVPSIARVYLPRHEEN